ncbi:MAG: (Fe-S)-binding protein [Deltaproteobacteria bacterium]|nr:(Fe-S)-binding protein [Deltaproteobacteria bacterium]
MMQKHKAERGKWAEDLDLKALTGEKTDILYHAGCRYSFDEELWPTTRAAFTLLNKAGVRVSALGSDEACCGGRAYEWGYMGELTKYVEHNVSAWRTAKVKTLVTSCADCYGTFKSIYPMVLGKSTEDLGVEVLHITEFLDRLIKQGKIKPKKEMPLRVTYHDPCHLGRLGEPYKPWSGEYKTGAGGIIYTAPQKPIRHGIDGIYDAPRNVLASIPGVMLYEMERIKHFSWCCGAGGGVKEAYPDFALWTALDRIEEAKATGAQAITTACPWCKQNFKDALKQSGDRIDVYDVVDLLQRSL